MKKSKKESQTSEKKVVKGEKSDKLLKKSEKKNHKRTQTWEKE